MKKLIALLIVSLAIDSSMGQANLSMSLGTRMHYQLEAGYVDPSTGITLAGGFGKSLVNEITDPFILHIKGGYEFLIGDDFNITPMVGYASHKFTGSETNYNYREDHAIFSIEAGKDWYMGRLFVGANKTGKELFFNIGIKARFQ